MADDTTEVTETAPPELEEGTGIALHGDGYPVNLRLRAERLHADGKSTDEAGMVTDEAIAAAGERVAADEAAAAEAAKANDLSRKSHDELDAIAIAESVDLATASTKADKIALIEAAREAQTEGNN